MASGQASIDNKVIKATQDDLGKIIEKPQLTEKLLKRPPFRFLHDIIANVIQTNQVFNGLYQDKEMVAENINDKTAKIDFLQKIIDVLGFMQGSPLSVKAAKVVAGLEPEKTNELLQTLAKVTSSKKNTDDAVKRVLAGEKPKKSVVRPEKSPVAKKPVTDSSRKTAVIKPTTTKQPSTKTSVDKPGEKLRNTVKTTTKSSPNSSKSSSPKETELKKKKVSPVTSGKPKSNKSELVVEKKELETKRLTVESTNEEPTSPSPSLPHLTVRPPTGLQRMTSPSERPPPTARPTTARAAPPKVLSKRDIEEMNEKVMQEQTHLEIKPVENLISEKDMIKDDDEDDIYVVEEAKDALENENSLRDTLDVSNLDDKKGSLVKQLVETKNELDSDSVEKETNDGINRLAIRDVSRLKESIQTLTRLAIPLGRVLDYLQEDIASMVSEYRSWDEEHRENLSKLEKERQTSNKSLDPLREQLDDLDKRIEVAYEKIYTRKRNIIKNENIINKIITMAIKHS